MKPIKEVLVFVHETWYTYRFEAASITPIALEVVYIKKTAFDSGLTPTTITVTVEGGGV